MNYYLVEGTLTDPDRMTQEILDKHIAYTTKAYRSGKILFSGLKEGSQPGGILLLRAESELAARDYVEADPISTEGIQKYHITPFQPHNVHKDAKAWFGRG